MSEYKTVALNLSLPDHLVEKLVELSSEFGITLSALVMSLLQNDVQFLQDIVIMARENREPLRKFGTVSKPQRATSLQAPIIRDYLASLCSRNIRGSDVSGVEPHA